jgi:hypothetical protein
MLRVAFAIVFALGFGGAALASKGGRSESQCRSLDSLEKKLSDAKFTPLTPGQFHFAEGVYVGSPGTPEELPPGDGALLAQRAGEKGGMLIWTRGNKLACSASEVPEKFIKLMQSISTGALDADGDEL